MEEMSNKALIIAVSLIVTMTIASGVLYTINQVRQLYKQIYETNTSIQSSFDEFSAYDGGEKTYLDFENAVKKYRNSDTVFVIYGIEKVQIPDFIKNEERIQNVILQQKLKDENYVKNNSLIFENEHGNFEIKQGKESNFNHRFKTYVERLDDGRIIIFFEPIY